ncbi:unnamed protein product (macronuclear) [Paramecium tetraurelia]|uniref:Transmembrane protein n=1 Tax=Paramecium tetraurelia TaxID=5888 RepID=A0C757_PARTE|nr:uncharacterized protein GSPATT00035754001 [Paramecium tetraurelia]CAK66624.1 unnamed protein product [Paramecium tetraurelia]|eukprot:XP_001434021.1 hypothetical protein (macronuclear) [Paramecium tetraurelia strain d4-2]
MKLSTILRRLDIFGVPITLIGFNRLKYQTKLGGLVSLALVGWLTYNIILQFVSLISKNKLLVTTNTIFSDTPSLIELNSQNFMFALQIRQSDYINKPYFTFKLEHISVTDGFNKTTQTVPFTKCTIKDFENLYFYNVDMFEQLVFNNYTDWVCPQFGNITYALQGKFGSKLFQYLKISAIPCKPGQYDYDYQCPSTEETIDYINSIDGELNINLMITNVNVNTAQTNSYTGFLDRDYYMLLNPLKQFGSVDMFLRNWDVYTNPSIIDDGTDYDYQNYVVLEKQETSEKQNYHEYDISKNQEIAKLFFRTSQYSLYTKRNYVSIGDFLAYVGGIFGSLYTIGALFMSIYAYEQLWLKLFKVHYNFVAYDRNCKSLNEIIKNKFSQENILIPNMKSFLLFFTKQGIQNIKTYIQSQTIIMEDLSVVNYLKTVKDLQKIKKILFNEKQTQILDLYNKETIAITKYQAQHSHKLEKGKKFLYGQHFQDHTLQTLRKIIDQYQSLLYDKDKFQLKITQRLINIFDNDFQEVINNWENGYYQLKTLNTTNYDNVQQNRMPQLSQQFAISKDITKIINFRNQYNLTNPEIESLLKTLFFKKQTLYLDENFNIQYEVSINQEEEKINYVLTIHNKFQQYQLDIKQSDILVQHQFTARKHKIECNLMRNKSISLLDLISCSLEVTINSNYTIYLNCSLNANIQYQLKVINIPKDFRTHYYIYLDDYNKERFQLLFALLQQQKFMISNIENFECMFQFDSNGQSAQYIEIFMNWPNNEIILNELIISNKPYIQFLQVLYDIIILYLQNL